jgi:hypothetical protein
MNIKKWKKAPPGIRKLIPMFYIKHLIIFSLLLLSLQSFSQNGFSMDIQIDSAENVLKNYYKKNKNNPEKKFLTDNTSSDLSKGFLFRDIEMSTFELFAANFSFSDKDQVQKSVFNHSNY